MKFGIFIVTMGVASAVNGMIFIHARISWYGSLLTLAYGVLDLILAWVLIYFGMKHTLKKAKGVGL